MPLRRFFRGALFTLTIATTLVASLRAACATETITIYRDEFGTPHIYAATAEGACFGHGYAQATDRLERVAQAIPPRRRNDERSLRSRVSAR